MKNKIKKIEEQFAKRQNCTAQAKKDLNEILMEITRMVPDKVSGFRTVRCFDIKYSFWTGKWKEYSGEAIFKLKDGRAIIAKEGTLDEIEVDIEELEYININEAAAALEEFLRRLSEASTFEEGASKIRQVLKAIKEVG